VNVVSAYNVDAANSASMTPGDRPLEPRKIAIFIYPYPPQKMSALQLH